MKDLPMLYEAVPTKLVTRPDQPAVGEPKSYADEISYHRGMNNQRNIYDNV
jgi:hypothetical protein